MISETEPCLATDPELADILAELFSRERIHLWPELGTTRADFEQMLAAEFWEIGASGRRWSRAHALDVLEERCAVPQRDFCESTDYYCQRLAEDVYLLTYTLLENTERKTRRATIWRRTPEGWKIVFHQGTVVQVP